MVDKEIQKALDEANGLQKKKRIQLIREGVREKYPIPADEIAILRKTVKYLMDVIATIHPEAIDYPEFTEYFNYIENEVKGGID